MSAIQSFRISRFIQLEAAGRQFAIEAEFSVSATSSGFHHAFGFQVETEWEIEADYSFAEPDPIGADQKKSIREQLENYAREFEDDIIQEAAFNL